MLRDKFNLPKTRNEALKRGVLWYYTGKVCSNGHTSVRYVVGGKCKACTKEQKVRAEFGNTINSTRQRIENIKEKPDFEESW